MLYDLINNFFTLDFKIVLFWIDNMPRRDMMHWEQGQCNFGIDKDLEFLVYCYV